MAARRPGHAFDMTTNTNVPPSQLDRPRSAHPWFPHSWTAWGILVVGAACAAAPSYYAACIALLSYVCFDACGTPAQIAT